MWVLVSLCPTLGSQSGFSPMVQNSHFCSKAVKWVKRLNISMLIASQCYKIQSNSQTTRTFCSVWFKTDSFKDPHIICCKSFQDPLEDKCNLVQTDSFQDPSIFVYGTQHNPFILTPFKTPGSYMALNCSNWLHSRLQHSPWETNLKLMVLKLHGRLPSTKLVISRQFHSDPWTHFKTLKLFWQCFDSPWETFLRKLIPSGSFYTVNFGVLSRPLWLIHHIQWMDSFQDHLEEEKKTEHTAVQFQWPFGLL